MANASVRTKKIVKKTKNKTVKVKQTAGSLGVLKNTIVTAQVFIGFYAFFNVIFWLAYTAKLVEQTGIYFVFKPAWDLVNIFYTYKATSGKEEVDFTGVVCAICLMVIAIILKSVSDFVAELEETAKIEDARRLERANKKLLAESKGVLKSKKTNTSKDSGFIFVLDIDIKQVSGFIQEEAMSPEEIAKLKTNFFSSLLNNLNLNQVTQKGYFKKKLFLVYKNVSYFDDFIFYTRETLTSLSREFTKPTLRIDFLVGMNAVGLNEDFREKLDVLDTINKLSLKNEFICTQSLKDAYDCLPKQQYRLITKGIYNLSKNLNVSNNQEIFSLRETH